MARHREPETRREDVTSREIPLFFVPNEPFSPGRAVSLPASETRHVRSKRLLPGEPAGLLDGKGHLAIGVLDEGGESVAVERVVEGEGEPASRVLVFLGNSEPSRIEWAVEKGTECGAAGFYIVSLERTQRGHHESTASRMPRLRRIAAEAMKQCRRTVLPIVEGPISLREALALAPGVPFVAAPGAPRLQPPSELERNLSLFVGPEGGFSPAELSVFEAERVRVFSLGPRVLRVETAVVAALSHLVR
ncbi:MAG: 16S rRNA (uracil(1498)-N(3))-methyltransferase [Acidobacteria bacterium]|nr:16S rRNA (uracil(1498)-N(3))-methyltransferase [Acidobacteriota bacterium]MCG3193448.1 Ribosomal RNA small subunit methyltransferase E [Thermoanaerobaculia bacterium]